MTPNRRQLCLGAAAMAVSSLWSAAGAASPDRSWLRQPVLPDVPLLDQDGRRMHLQRDLIDGRTVVINFMFTGCQTVCPPQTALLREAMRRFDERGSARDLLVLSLTVDPLADGPAQLRAFGQRYQLPVGLARGWVLLTGGPADVARVLTAFDVPTGAPGDHPSLLWLGHAPSGRWTRSSSLNPPEALVSLIEDLRQ
jgi:protein SCO1